MTTRNFLAFLFLCLVAAGFGLFLAWATLKLFGTLAGIMFFVFSALLGVYLKCA